MKRSDRLIKLSREHHHALVLAKRAQELGSRPGPETEAFMAQLVATFDTELEAHFAAEEKTLLPALKRVGELALVERTLFEHDELRYLIRRVAERDTVSLIRFGVTLAAHVRFEERELFNAAEWVLTSETLNAIHRDLHHPNPQLQGA